MHSWHSDPSSLAQLRLRSTKGAPDAMRALELSLGTSAGGDVRWSEGAMMYTLAPGLLTSPNTFQNAQLPMVRDALM